MQDWNNLKIENLDSIDLASETFKNCLAKQQRILYISVLP